MGEYLAFLVQLLLLCFAPLIVFGLAVSLIRALYIYFLGDTRVGRSVLLLTVAPSVPLRVLGNTVMAVLFGHRITDICFLNVRDPDGELGFVEHTYRSRNPIAQMGKFFYALGPALVCTSAIFVIFFACFGDVIPNFAVELAQLAANGGDFFEYAEATFRVIPAMFSSQGGFVAVKILGAILILLLCMGTFVSVGDLVDSVLGLILTAVLGAFLSAVMMLFDARVRRVVLGGLQSFAAMVSALYLVILLACMALLALASLVFLIRFLYSTPSSSVAVQAHREEGNDGGVYEKTDEE